MNSELNAHLGATADDASDIYRDRMQRLLDRAAVDQKLSARDKGLVLRTINHVLFIHGLVPELLSEPMSYSASFWRDADAALTRLANALLNGDSEGALEATSGVLGTLILALDSAILNRSSTSFDEPLRASLQANVVKFRNEKEEIALVLEEGRYKKASRLLGEVEQLAEGARELAVGAQNTAATIQDAAGMSGSASLSIYFGAYAKAEKRSADVFRLFTIIAISVAVVAAILVPHPRADDWPALVYRVIVLLGIAGLGTYFGRQASQHRRMHNWAKALQVQLQSFPAFMEKIRDEDTIASIYTAFADRVLGAPPEKTGGQDPGPAVNATQLVELATTLAKRGE